MHKLQEYMKPLIGVVAVAGLFVFGGCASSAQESGDAVSRALVGTKQRTNAIEQFVDAAGQPRLLRIARYRFFRSVRTERD